MATVYIAPTAQGSADGTSEANAYAFSSLNTAESSAGVGGTIYFLDGTYTTTGETLDAFLTYESLNHGGAILDGTVSSLGDSARTFTVGADSSASPWAIKKFKFIDARFRLRMGNAGVVNTFSQNIITSSTRLLMGNGVGIFDSYNAGSGSITFTDNSIFASFSDSETRLWRGMQNYDVQRCSWFFSFGNSTQRDTAGDPGSGMKNNIWASDVTAAIENGLSLNSNSVNSCFYQMFTDNTASGTNINGDPLFVDTTTGDLRLRPSSPCINAGTAS